MSLESAEKLVERILRQLNVPYRVEERAEDSSRIMIDDKSLERLPSELRPYVVTEKSAASGKKADSGPGGDVD